MNLEMLLKNGKVSELFKELEKNKKNSEVSIKILDEINNRLLKKEFEFTNKDTNFIYLYMFLSNKYEIISVLNKLINDKNFIAALDKTRIDASIIPALTYNCEKPRSFLLTNSKKLKKAILNDNGLLGAKDILDDLTNEEIKILRTDLEIDNHLINKGIRFDTLKKETVNRILSEVYLLNTYSIETISEFANYYKNTKELANNEEFIELYLSKLNNDYTYENKVLKYLSKIQIENILLSNPSDHLLLHLLKDGAKEVQSKLLKDKKIKNILEKCNDINILKNLPKKTIIEILSSRKNLFTGTNLQLLNTLSKKDLETIINNNKNYYQELINKLKSTQELDLTVFIHALPQDLITDLSEKQIYNFNIKSILTLMKTNNKIFKISLLEKKEVCNKLIDELTIRTFYKLEDLFKYGNFNLDEKIKFINKIENINNSKVLQKLINTIPEINRKSLYENENIRLHLLKSNEVEVDNYTVKHFLNNIEELKQMSPKVIIEIMKQSDATFASKLLADDIILNKLFKNTNPEELSNLIDILKANKELLPIFTSQKVISYYNRDNFYEITKHLEYSEKLEICTQDLIKHILDNNEELFNLYKKLDNKNRFILNTLDFRILTKEALNLKLSILDLITKDKDIQNYIVKINKQISIIPNFINVLFFNTTDISIDIIRECLKLISESCDGVNRKNLGNIPKILNVVNPVDIAKQDIRDLINYLMYFIPRFYNKNDVVNKPTRIETPTTFNEIRNYEEMFNEYLTSLILQETTGELKKLFIEKHFKLSIDEAKEMLKLFSISRIDENVYKEEYEYLSNLNKIINTDYDSLKELDHDYKVISMYDSYIIENKIRNMYGKIYNYEIRSKNYTIKPFTKNAYGKEIKIFECPNDFMFLLSNVEYEKELQQTNSYIEAWHNALNKTKYVNASLISNDNININGDINFCFNGVLDEGIKKISSIRLSEIHKEGCNEIFMTPRELIDSTRDINNTILIDKYAIRPNFNNSNIPNIEPDFILVNINKLEDEHFLELISRISEEFKTKRNKNGLPIIAIDLDKITKNELSKIKTLTSKYNKNHDMNILNSILIKLSNNYSSYEMISTELKEKFELNSFMKMLEERINTTHSIAELNYIEEILNIEVNKYNSVSNKKCCSINLREIKKTIDLRKEILNN